MSPLVVFVALNAPIVFAPASEVPPAEVVVSALPLTRPALWATGPALPASVTLPKFVDNVLEVSWIAALDTEALPGVPASAMLPLAARIEAPEVVENGITATPKAVPPALALPPTPVSDTAPLPS